MSKAKQKLITRQELAKALDVHEITITKWQREGMPVAKRGGRGRPSYYDEVEVRQWQDAREEAARTSEHLDVIQQRARKERAQALLAEQTLAIRARELVPRRDVEKAWAAEVSAVRAKLLVWPATISPQLARVATLEGANGVEAFLKSAVDDLLNDLSQPDDGEQDMESTSSPARKKRTGSKKKASKKRTKAKKRKASKKKKRA